MKLRCRMEGCGAASPAKNGCHSFAAAVCKGKWVEDIVMGKKEDDFNVVEVIRTEKVPPMWTKPRDQLLQSVCDKPASCNQDASDCLCSKIFEFKTSRIDLRENCWHL